MRRESFDDLGEPYFDDWFRKILIREGIIYLPPGSVRNIDYVLSNELIIVELEDTAFEIYNAINQIKRILSIIRSLNLGIAVAIPFPKRIEMFLVTGAKFFNEFRNYRKKEIWLFYTDLILRIHSDDFEGFNLKFRYIKEERLKVRLYNGFFTKDTAIELDKKLRKFI